MKIQICSSGIGASTFLRRMKKCMSEKYDVEFVKKNPDIYLTSPWRGNPPHGAKRIHRADGVYFDTLLSGKTGMNKRIAEAINKSHAVIYQSNHAKMMCQGILRVKNRRDVIIYNGADEIDHSKIEVDKMGFDKMLVACAKWRPLKRPISIAKGFLAAGLHDAVLVMIGKIDSKHKVKHTNIKYVGQINAEDTWKYYSSCDGVIHISRMDACPNVVVEALVAGKPVLGNNIGGTPELIQKDGVIIKVDPTYDYKMFAMKNPDSVKSKYIAPAIHELLNTKWDIKRSDLTIGYSSKQYYEYFKQVLSC